MTVAYPRKLRNNLSARDILKRVVSEREIHLVTLTATATTNNVVARIWPN